MGFGSMSNTAPVNTNSMMNQIMLQNLQTLLAAHPSFVTGGIPTKLLSALYMEPTQFLSQLLKVRFTRFNPEWHSKR